MKLRNQFLTLAAALVVGGSFLAGCTTDNTVTPPTTDNRTKAISSPGVTKMVIGGFVQGHLYAFSVTGSSPITKIAAANSTAPDSITIFWTRDAGDIGADTVNYIEVTSPTTSDPVTAATAITWATASVTKGLMIYETADGTPGHGSGLVLGATSRVVSVVGADTSNVDLVLATDNQMSGLPYMTLVSPSLTQYSFIYNGRRTYLGDVNALVGGGSANDKFSQSIEGNFSTKANRQDLYDGDFKDTALVVYLQTADATPHYAAVEVVPQPNGSGGTQMWTTITTPAGKQRNAIVVNVYYQTTAGWGYVGRPGIVRRGSYDAVVRSGMPNRQ